MNPLRWLASLMLASMLGCAANPDSSHPRGEPAAPPADEGVTESGPSAPPGSEEDAPPAAPACVAVGAEECGNGLDDDCDPATDDICRPASCVEVIELGVGVLDGVYTLTLPVLGERDVYCDLTREGGGWALAANAPEGGYDEMPVVGVVTPEVHGRVDDLTLTALLASPSDARNNVRVELHAPARVVSMRAVLEMPGHEGPDGAGNVVARPHRMHVEWTANGDCSAYDDGPDDAIVEPSDAWSIYNGSGNGSIGFQGDGTSRGSFVGFYTNHDTASDLTCNRTTEPGTWQPNRPGALWTR